MEFPSQHIVFLLYLCSCESNISEHITLFHFYGFLNNLVNNVHYNQSLEHLLLLTGTTLTSLDIITNHLDKVQDVLYAIFSKCPNLKRLRYYINTKAFSSFNPCNRTEDITILTEADNAIKKAMQQVEYLELPFHLTRTAPETLNQCISLFTGLKHLYLTCPLRVYNRSILDWIDNTFPSLQTIWINKSPYKINGNNSNTYLSTNNFGRPGYKYLSYNDMFIDGKSVERFLAKYKATNFSAFHYTVNLVGSGTTTEFMNHFIMKDLVPMAQYLRSLALQDYRNIILDDDDDEDEGHGVKKLVIDIDNIMYYFPCLEQLVLEGVTINAKEITSSAAASSTMETSIPTATSIFKNDNNDSSNSKCIQRSLKSFSIKHCQGVTVYMLITLINARFQRHMDCIYIAGLDNNDVLDQVLDAISKNVQVLDRLGLCNNNLNNTIARRIIDSWDGKRLNSLEINGPNQVISPRGVISYARQKLKYTIVNINSDES